MATTTTTSTTASTTPTTTPGMRAALALSASSTGGGSTEVVIATLVVCTWLVDMELAANEDGEIPEGEFDGVPELLITGMVVSIESDILEVGLVAGRLEVGITDSSNVVSVCAKLDIASLTDDV